MRRFIFGILLVPVVALAIGCGTSEPTTGSNASGSGAAWPVAVPGTVALTEISAETLVSGLDGQKGKVVLVDFWATWCPPCRARFPHFVKTHTKYASKGLLCVSVSLDNDGPGGRADQKEVLEFLKTHGAEFPNFLLTDYRKEAAKVGRRYGLEGAIPFVALFDKTGKKVWDRSQQELSDADLDSLIETELAK